MHGNFNVPVHLHFWVSLRYRHVRIQCLVRRCLSGHSHLQQAGNLNEPAVCIPGGVCSTFLGRGGERLHVWGRNNSTMGTDARIVMQQLLAAGDISWDPDAEGSAMQPRRGADATKDS